MSSMDVVKGRDGQLIFPMQYVLFLARANVRINSILRETDEGEAE